MRPATGRQSTTADEAFERLVVQSLRSNTKLDDIAHQLLDSLASMRRQTRTRAGAQVSASVRRPGRLVGYRSMSTRRDGARARRLVQY